MRLIPCLVVSVFATVLTLGSTARAEEADDHFLEGAALRPGLEAGVSEA